MHSTLETHKDFQRFSSVTLSTFKEQEKKSSTIYRTIHVQECVKVMLERDDRVEPLNPTPLSRKRTEKKQRGKQLRVNKKIGMIN